MPRELVAVAPRSPVVREVEEPELGPRQIRIQTELVAPKHGTVLVADRNEPSANRPDDAAWGAVIPRPASQELTGFPPRLGNMAGGASSRSLQRSVIGVLCPLIVEQHEFDPRAVAVSTANLQASWTLPNRWL